MDMYARLAYLEHKTRRKSFSSCALMLSRKSGHASLDPSWGVFGTSGRVNIPSNTSEAWK